MRPTPAGPTPIALSRAKSYRRRVSMERRNEIRAAMQRLLSSSRPPEEASQGTQTADPAPASTESSVALSPAQVRTLREIQAALRAYSIEADMPDVVQALMESLAT